MSVVIYHQDVRLHTDNSSRTRHIPRRFLLCPGHCTPSTRLLAVDTKFHASEPSAQFLSMSYLIITFLLRLCGIAIADVLTQPWIRVVPCKGGSHAAQDAVCWGVSREWGAYQYAVGWRG